MTPFVLRALLLCLLTSACGGRSAGGRTSAKPAPPAPETVRAPLEAGDAYFKMETPLRVDGSEGPVVGRAMPGARGKVLEVNGAWATVELTELGEVRISRDRVSILVVVFVPSDTLGHAPVPSVESPLLGTLVHDHEGGYSASIGSDFPYFQLRCGPVRIMEERTVEGRPSGPSTLYGVPAQRRFQRLAQMRAGIELSGWNEQPLRSRRGQNTCGGFVYKHQKEPTPSGYRRPAADAGPRLASLLASGQELHWIKLEYQRPVCRAWHVENGELVTSEYVYQGDERRPTVRAHYGFSLDGTRIVLEGPRLLMRGGRRHLRMRCVEYLEVVRVDDRRVSVIPAMGSVGAYDPTSAIAWYFSAEECETARELLDLSSDDKGVLAAAMPPPSGGC